MGESSIKTSFLRNVLFPLGLSFFAVPSLGAEGQTVKVDISHIGDATHLEFSGSVDWKYDFRRVPGGVSGQSNQVVLRIPGLSADTVKKLLAQNDGLIKNIKVADHGIDEKFEVAFAVNDQTDFFDYISDQPSRLIIDFFPKDEPKAPSQAAKVSEKLPPKKPALAKKIAISEVSKATVDDDDEDEDDDAKPAQKAKGRVPAGDVVLVAKSELPEAPSLAEQISSKKDFSHGIFDGGDPEFKRFSIRDYEISEKAILASQDNYYLPFPMLELGMPQLKALISAPPTYEIVPKDNRENKEARILLTLFSSKQRALFLKAAREFVESYPESPYDEVVRYMIGDAHYDIWRANNSIADFDLAMNTYLSLVGRYPESPMTPRTYLLMGYSYLDRGDSFGALKSLEHFARQFPNSKHIDRVKLSIAEAYLKLDRYDDTYNLLDQVEKEGKSPSGREEAAFRKGDIFFKKKDYSEAIRQYESAIARHPAAANRFPNIWYNRAEAEFNLKKYKECLESYRVFLQKFPDHQHGGFAMTRMGELLGILGANGKRAQGAFLESYFRYRATPGAGVARIRLLTGRMTEMKDKELASALREVEQITARYADRTKTKKELEQEKAEATRASLAEAEAEERKKAAAGKHGEGGEQSGKKSAKAEAADGSEEPDFALAPKDGEEAQHRRAVLPGIEEFSSLLISDGQSARHEYDLATKELINYHQKNPQSPNREKFKSRIVRNLASGLRSAVEHGDFIDALRRYSGNADGWFKNSDRVDLHFDLGRAYEAAGVFAEAEGAYQDCLKRIADIKAEHKEKEHEALENFPSSATVELRLAAVSAKGGSFAAAETHLKKITNPSELSGTEQVESAELSADVAEARGEGGLARTFLANLIKTWNGDPQLTSPLHLRLAKLEISAKNFKVADEHLATILRWKKENPDKVSAEVEAKALETRADLFVARGERTNAVRTYRELLTQYEKTRPLASVRYRLGQILYQDGDLKGAEQAWGELTADRDGLWQHLAAEEMRGSKWQSEYKKYLDRIPAAAPLREPQQ